MNLWRNTISHNPLWRELLTQQGEPVGPAQCGGTGAEPAAPPTTTRGAWLSEGEGKARRKAGLTESSDPLRVPPPYGWQRAAVGGGQGGRPSQQPGDEGEEEEEEEEEEQEEQRGSRGAGSSCSRAAVLGTVGRPRRQSSDERTTLSSSSFGL